MSVIGALIALGAAVAALALVWVGWWLRGVWSQIKEMS